MPVWGHSRSYEDRRVKRGARPVLLGRHRLKVQDVGLETRLTACVVLGVESGGCHTGSVVSQGPWAVSGDISCCHSRRLGLLASSGWSPATVRDGPHGRGPPGSTRLRKSGGGPSACLHLLGGDPGRAPCLPHAASLCLSPQNPDIVLVHYLNVPAIEDCGKPCGPILCSINTDKKEWAKWTKEELIGQLKPMCE